MNKVLSHKLLLNLNEFEATVTIQKTAPSERFFFLPVYILKSGKFSMCSFALQCYSKKFPKSFASYVQTEKERPLN